MATLESYGQEISNIFQLLGDKENDITLSLSWVLNKCPVLLKSVVENITGFDPDPENISIYNQRYDSETGITDIEITDHQNFHIIIEAKRGWILPGAEQLTRYSLRKDFCKARCAYKNIVTLSECSQTYANEYLPFHEVNGIPVRHLSYRDVFWLARQSYERSNNEQKHLLTDFCDYLKGLMTMQNLRSNMVYVVSLSYQKALGSDISWVDIVKKYNKYFCPVGGNGWPKEPPNYIAFRYDGQLQSIHHIEGYTVARDIHEAMPVMPTYEFDHDHFVYDLGPAIVPGKPVKTGKIFHSARVWAMLDTLLTCDTISDAQVLTAARLEQEGPR